MRDGSTLPGWPLLLRRELAAQYLGMSRTTFDAERKAGRIPKAVPITAGLEAWHRGDLDAWAEDRRMAAEAAATSNPWD